MWAILLGCILREDHCNNREGEGREGEKAEGEGSELLFHDASQSHNAIVLESLWDVLHNQ